MPDYIDFAMPQGALVKAQNVLPYDEYYSTAKDQVVESSGAITGTAIGAKEVVDIDGTYYGLVGTTTKLYRVEANLDLTDVTRVAGDYTATADDNSWNFVQYGTWIIATNYSDVVQVLKGISASNYVALGGSPPKAKYAVLYNGHLVLGYVNESAVANSKKLVWSAFESLENWTPALATGCGFQEIADSDGGMTGLAVAGTTLLIFFENSITTGYYSGAPYTFGFNTNFFHGIGAIPNTMVSVGELCYFFDRKDFYVTDGSTVKSIGNGVRNTILSGIDIGHANRISTCHDTRRGLIMWAVPTTESTDGSPNRIIIYNYNKARWTYIDDALQCLLPVHTGATLLDDLDATYAELDLIPYYADSNVWLDASAATGCITSTGYVASYTGSAKAGVIETGDVRDEQGHIMTITGVHPLIKTPSAGTVSVRVGHRMQEQDSVAYSASVAVGSTSNRAVVRNSGRLLRVELTTANHLGIAPVIEADIVAQGRR